MSPYTFRPQVLIDMTAYCAISSVTCAQFIFVNTRNMKSSLLTAGAWEDFLSDWRRNI